MIESELLFLKEQIYNKCLFQIDTIEVHNESVEYLACSFHLNESKIIFRKSKITPKKVGQFVTFWKRSDLGPIIPYHENDMFDFFVVNSYNKEHFGQFVFPKSILIQKNIISNGEKEGKRAFRVYPPWENVTSKQAEKTQSWQKNYFSFITNDLDIHKLKEMYTK